MDKIIKSHFKIGDKILCSYAGGLYKGEIMGLIYTDDVLTYRDKYDEPKYCVRINKLGVCGRVNIYLNKADIFKNEQELEKFRKRHGFDLNY